MTTEELAKELAAEAQAVLSAHHGRPWAEMQETMPDQVLQFLMARFPELEIETLYLLVANHVQVTDTRMAIDFDAIAAHVMGDTIADTQRPAPESA